MTSLPEDCPKPGRPRRVISGGQTGVDRAALDVAIALGIPRGGWCPRGRLAEDGRIPLHYPLRETATGDYAERTERNVLDADATLILHAGPLRGGTLLTRELAERHGKPCLCVDLDATPDPADAARWLEERAAAVLNVAGPRESQSPGIADRARRFLLALWQGGK
ncbi:MAG: putative molybdenum carrier protein [Pirellulales bacterium]|nr:putative molybdenum carrier protein [Pirellulales bacterium]